MTEDIRQRLRTFLQTNKLSVIATRFPDGSPHASVMHYSCALDPIRLFYSTDDRSQKVSNARIASAASVAIGWSETEWVTVQMRGKVELAEPLELTSIKSIHYAVHPNSRKFEDDPHTVFLRFSPQWIRFSDLGVEPAIIEEIEAL